MRSTLLRLLVLQQLLGLACGSGAHAPGASSRRVSRSVVGGDGSGLRALRGGQAGAAAAAVEPEPAAPRARKAAALTDAGDEPMPTRMRLNVASGETADASLAEVHPDTLAALGLSGGDCVLLRGKKMRRTALIVNSDDALAVGEIRVSASAKSNVNLAEADEVMLERVLLDDDEAEPNQLPEAERLLVLPFEEDVKGFDGDAFEASLKPFLKGNERTFSLGDTIFTKAEGDDERTIRWKVLEMEPTHMEAHALVTSATQLYPDGDPLTEEDLEEDEVIGYEDIGGLHKQISMIHELVHLPLKHPEVFARLGVPPPRGMLLHGPPGSGKTMLAKAMKTEVGIYFKQLNGPEVMSKRSGESEAGLRKVFEEAKENAPAIIFIDEVDAIAPKREKAQGEVERRIVSQLLTLMDGLGSNSGVMVVAATNRAGVIDPALRRFGRFDREIDLGIPDMEGRLEILKIKAKPMKLHEEVDLEQVAADTHGYCGADLGQLVTEAAMQTVRERAGDIDVDADEVPAELLASMVVKNEHFKVAMTKCQPSSLRDKAVEMPDTSWDDVGGLLDVKREMVETLQFPLKYAAKYTRFGMQPSKGMLLYGPSGCGKTLVAKAIANEVKSNFISVKGPELLSMWFGESESNVRELFNKARGAAPCILFFDEIDSIAKKRGGNGGGGEAGDRIVNQILTEIDGVGAKKSVFCIAATNRPDMIDPALTRPGRLDQLVYLPLPDAASRLAILKSCTRKSPLGDDVDLDQLSEEMDGFSGADITEVCQRSAKLAIRQLIFDSEAGLPTESSCSLISRSHFDSAMQVARRSVSASDVKKFERFKKSMQVNQKG